MFYLGGVGLAFFLTLLLVTKQKKTVADKILTGWLLVITFHLLLYYFWRTEIYPGTLGLEISLPLVHGPFLYLYTLALTNRIHSWKITALHFLTPAIVFAYTFSFLRLPVEQKIWVYAHQGAGYETFNQVKTILIIVSGVLYVLLSSFELRKHRIAITNQFSDTDKINLRWLQYLIYGISVIWFFVIVGNNDWIYASAVLFVTFIGFFGIRQVGIFHTQQVENPVQPVTHEATTERDLAEDASLAALEKRKYQKSGLSAENSEALHRLLTEVMRSEKLFCLSELSLADLAARLDAPPNYLSQMINEREGKNFYDYINSLRVEEFKRLASDPDSRKYTLIALAQQCGFNSKSTFNRYFKKVTGQSPSEFVTAAYDSAQ